MTCTPPAASGGDDTIVAVITPPGQGGVAAVRIAGPDSLRLLKRHFIASSISKPKPFLMRYGQFRTAQGESLDEVLAVFMPAGQSYTGLEQVEIFCHGGRQVVNTIMQELTASGARPAEPGEFTKLAFLSGRIDLPHAEAVAEMIAADTRVSFDASREHLLGAYSDQINSLREQLVELLGDIEASIDFTEQDIDAADSAKSIVSLQAIVTQIDELVATYRSGRIIKEGFRIAICGRPNAGKSSLFNLLLKQERALVHPTAGTTRDYLSEWIDFDGIAVNLIDTAGLRKGGGQLEQRGQDRTRRLIRDADLVIWMVDLTMSRWQMHLKGDLQRLDHEHIVLVGNKIDLLQVGQEPCAPAISGGSQQVAVVGRESPTPADIGRSRRDLPYKELRISCLTRAGLKKLRSVIRQKIDECMPDLTSGLVVTSARHKQKFTAASRILKRVIRMAKAGETQDIIAYELRSAVDALDEITGKVYNEQVLERIFSRFCVGK